ncbi:hypothetical protein B0H11DRAFT_1913430 [Mycena galericulata]|nr:hypothetical protein B0H11DRAFT_1913430 [Mycena galericulata]
MLAIAEAAGVLSSVCIVCGRKETGARGDAWEPPSENASAWPGSGARLRRFLDDLEDNSWEETPTQHLGYLTFTKVKKKIPPICMAKQSPDVSPGCSESLGRYPTEKWSLSILSTRVDLLRQKCSREMLVHKQEGASVDGLRIYNFSLFQVSHREPSNISLAVAIGVLQRVWITLVMALHAEVALFHASHLTCNHSTNEAE